MAFTSRRLILLTSAVSSLVLTLSRRGNPQSIHILRTKTLFSLRPQSNFPLHTPPSIPPPPKKKTQEKAD